MLTITVPSMLELESKAGVGTWEDEVESRRAEFNGVSCRLSGIASDSFG